MVRIREAARIASSGRETRQRLHPATDHDDSRVELRDGRRLTKRQAVVISCRPHLLKRFGALACDSIGSGL